MSADGYKTRLSDLVDMSIIPGDMQGVEASVEGFVDNILGDVRYSDHLVFPSHHGDAKLHTLSIHAPTKELGADRMPVRFVITGDDGIACTFRWHWPVMRYAPLFDIAKPWKSALALFDMAMDFIDFTVTGDDAMQLLEELLSELFGEDVDLDGVTDFQSFRNAIDQQTTFAIHSIAVSVLQPLYDAFRQDPEEVWPLVRELFRNRVGNLTLDDAISVLRDVFYARMGLSNWSEFNDLLLPYLRLSAHNVSIGVEFSEKWLTPVDGNGVALTGQRSVLDFQIGDVVYDTRTGIAFNDAIQGDLQRSMIANTGLVLTITEAKLDYSHTESIPEIAAAGYSDSFRGVFIKLARLELPPKWFHPKIPVADTIPQTPGSKISLAITAEDVVIGTGKITGDLKLQHIKAVKVA